MSIDRRVGPRRDSDLALAEVLSAVRVELAELAVSGLRLQDILGVAIGQGGARPDAALIEEAQGLDRMVQRLSALSDFIQAVTADLPPAWRLDVDQALDALPLTDLARRLGRREMAEAVESGEFEAF